MSDIVKQGYVKFQSKNLGIWKKRWLVLKMHSRRGPVRLEKYSDEVASLSSGKYRMIDLSKVENIYRLPDFEKKCAIHITVDCMQSVQFSVDSELECENWLKMIQGEIQGALINRVCVNIYSPDSFNVYLTKHPKLPTHGECTMEITDTEIRLLNHRDQEIVFWPINKLRKYGVERNMFTIEAGRSCVTGEGTFVFESEASDDIYSRVNNVIKSQALAKRNEVSLGVCNREFCHVLHILLCFVDHILVVVW
ncbi:hypothetical protein HELRODRAFT_78097 [Helobdella robusta]|uniref:Protein chico n=1 Tax=Helobdella robusta TaxID=6412 RepID=T1G377_HELRO|nr:hypothetical protein HELRODRAFT_78097 [Helobdella robusta]ESO04972.1 hypothetical protein HELRODRAFT_78097 [Helobdella robusta]